MFIHVNVIDLTRDKLFKFSIVNSSAEFFFLLNLNPLTLSAEILVLNVHSDLFTSTNHGVK